MSLFSWSAAAFAAVDRGELLAWDPKINAPTWRRPLEGQVLALAAGGTMLATLHAGGNVAFWRGGMARPWGCAVAAPDRIHVLDAQGPRVVAIAGATALRFSRDDRQLAAGFPDGRVAILDVASGAVVRSAQLASEGAAVTALFERAPGAEWLVTAGSALRAVDPQSAVRRVTGLAANLEYPERTITGLALGDGALWVGLDRGDGNKYDLTTGGLLRTDPHPGRSLERWIVATGHHPEIARPAL